MTIPLRFRFIAAAVVTTLAMTAMTVFAAGGDLPGAASTGQDRAAAGATNGQADTESAGADAASVGDQLSTNLDRLLANMNDVWTRLDDGSANQAAADAVSNVIDTLGGDIGLNRALDAVSGSSDHPTAETHPTGRP